MAAISVKLWQRFTQVFKSKTPVDCRVIMDSRKFSGVTPELESNPFYQKYATKIDNLRKIDPAEFSDRIESISNPKNAHTSVNKETLMKMTSGEAKVIDKHSQLNKGKCLDDVMKTEMLMDKSASEIENLWLSYHKLRTCIAAVIPQNIYTLISERAKEFSTFLLPLPRKDGFEFVVCQFHGNEIHFTPLIAYQTHKENAPECLTVVHFVELFESKGIVLMKGDYNDDVLQAHEAQCLINQIQLYYGQNNERRLQLLYQFTHKPEEFKHMDLIAELETLSL